MGTRRVRARHNAGMERERIVVPAPAKLNLFLHVTGRRSDGYHTLESLFVPIDLCDTVTLDCRDDGVITRPATMAGVAEEDDLAVRAARALQEATRSVRGVTIAIDKRIPMGGGLGGGSSDAASVLLALNRLWRSGLSRHELARIGATLGADVPFFVFGEPALARGTGDELAAVTVPRDWIALVVPPAHVATAAIFAAAELTRNTPSAKMDVFSESYGRNDLQPVAAARFPAIAAALSELARHGPGARMTGSGACVFARFASRSAAEAAVASTLRGVPAMRGIVTRVLGRHPLANFA